MLAVINQRRGSKMAYGKKKKKTMKPKPKPNYKR
jgi:hypothetical protein